MLVYAVDSVKCCSHEAGKIRFPFQSPSCSIRYPTRMKSRSVISALPAAAYFTVPIPFVSL
jgi:hypothetical protein